MGSGHETTTPEVVGQQEQAHHSEFQSPDKRRVEKGFSLSYARLVVNKKTVSSKGTLRNWDDWIKETRVNQHLLIIVSTDGACMACSIKDWQTIETSHFDPDVLLPSTWYGMCRSI